MMRLPDHDHPASQHPPRRPVRSGATARHQSGLDTGRRRGEPDRVGSFERYRRADRNGEALGFILCLTEGTTYESPNYLWFSARYPSFAYCDRIAIAPEARGRGLGEQLYRAAFKHFTGQRETLLCEVNLAPPNPGSLRLHERLGFRAVGEAWSDDRTKGVVYLERKLDGA